MASPSWTFAAALVALAAGLAHAGDPVKLDKAELEKLLTGKTISYTNVNASPALVTFEKDGRATYKSGNSKTSFGTWQAGDDGRYCIKITNGTVQDHCRRVWKTDTGYAIGSRGGEMIPVTGLD